MMRAAASFRAEAGHSYYIRTVFERRKEREPAIKIEQLDEAKRSLLITSSAFNPSEIKKQWLCLRPAPLNGVRIAAKALSDSASREVT
jgi:hypothetical protein